MSDTTERIAVGAIGVRFRLTAQDTDGALTMFECEVPAGARVPAPHSHDAFEEVIYGLRGASTWTVGGQTREVGPGDAICVPRGVVHGFTNQTDESTMFLAVVTPGVFGPSYFREIGELLAAGGPPDLGAVGLIMERHGLTPAAPAPA